MHAKHTAEMPCFLGGLDLMQELGLKTHSTMRMRTNRSDLQLANASILLVFISELKENASKCNKDFRSTRENYQQCMIRRLKQETYILYF
jgi:hypothetical protein